MDHHETVAAQCDAPRTRLQAVAYRMLGSTSEAAHSHLLRPAADCNMRQLIVAECDPPRLGIPERL